MFAILGKSGIWRILVKYTINAHKKHMYMDIPVQELQKGIFLFKSDPDIESSVEIAAKLGQVLEVPGMPVVQTLTPRYSLTEEKSNYSGNFGMGTFPFHTDLAHWYVPPRYFLLRCICPSVEVTTNFISASKVFSQEDPILLKRSLFRPRRRLDGRLSILRLQQNELFRWDTLFIKPISNTACELQSRIEERLAKLPHLKVSLENRGDCILVDNWNVIHSRSSVPATDLSRKIERVYISKLKV